MDTETVWNDEVEATDLEMVAEMEAEILSDKAKLCRMSENNHDLFS